MQLKNQFNPTENNVLQERDVVLGKTLQFCSPVDKNGEGINDPAANLTCYSVKPSPSTKLQVISTDQFGPLTLDVKKRKTQLCVPSELLGQPTATPTADPSVSPTPTVTPIAPPILDHFELYSVKTTSKTEKFPRTEVSLEDDFLDETVELKKPVNLGVPTDKNGEGITSPSAHLTCYSMRAPRFGKTSVEVINQFGQFRLTLKKPNMLCVPSFKVVISEE